MPLIYASTKIQNYYRRNIGRVLFRKPFAIQPRQPFISFTFDDFPRSALHAGGKILAKHRLAGTYYVSLSLLGTEGVSGPHFNEQDLNDLLAANHELGCHTFGHCHSWDTDSQAFEDSILKNRAALAKLIPGAEFKSFSYPLSEPRALSKLKTARHFLCCRAGGQAFNSGTADLARLSAYFLEKSRDNWQAVRDIIDQNRQARGWLIFATHDIADDPSPYGCTPRFFEDVVQYAIDSGASVLPVTEAFRALNHSRAQSEIVH
jgi:peptidoglycan/xylan/chitin deacetylase (PgdA/CDA1 family)